MKNEYYCLIAGLPDLFFDTSKPFSTVKEFKSYLKDELSKEDYALIESFFWRFDNQNLLSQLIKDNKGFLHSGNLTGEDFETVFALIKEDAVDSFYRFLPDYFGEVIAAYRNDPSALSDTGWENLLAARYYDYATSVNNEFISKWYDYERGLVNILTALNCKKHQINIEPELIGESELNEKLIKSNARDFGIGNDFPRLEQLLRAIDEPALLEREKKIDLMKW